MIILKISSFSSSTAEDIRQYVLKEDFEKALLLCQSKKSFFSKLFACAIASRQYGVDVSARAIQAEGERQRAYLWKQTLFLKKLAWMALMLGLLGTVLTSFYDFYHVNQVKESLAKTLQQLKYALGPLILGSLFYLWGLFLTFSLQHKLQVFSNKLKEEALSLSTFVSLSDPD